MLLWLVLVLAPLASVGAASLLHALLYLAPALLFLVPLFLNRDPAGDLLVALARRREGRTLVARGCEPVTFPGDHGGFAAHPETFAAKLDEVLSA